MLNIFKGGAMSVIRAVLINLLVLEFLAAIGIYALGAVKPDRRLDLFIEDQLNDIDNDYIVEYMTKAYDEHLGWNTRPLSSVTHKNAAGVDWVANYNETGARMPCVATDETLFASYGDSYTHGDGVEDDATWQCVMEDPLQKKVNNFGVAGFGVVQAFIKMKGHWEKGLIAPTTLLVIYTDDIRRALNSYRPFLNPLAGSKLAFKPSYRIIDGVVVFFPNLLSPNINTKDQIKDLALNASQTDYWSQNHIRLIPGFPYAAEVISAGYRLLTNEGGFDGGDINVWDSHEGRQVMMHLLKNFALEANNYGTRPVVIFIPRVNEWSNGRKPPHYANFLTDVLQPANLDLTIIDISKAEFNEEKFSTLPFKGHPSMYGNQVIAKTIMDGLSLSQ